MASLARVMKTMPPRPGAGSMARSRPSDDLAKSVQKWLLPSLRLAVRASGPPAAARIPADELLGRRAFGQPDLAMIKSPGEPVNGLVASKLYRCGPAVRLAS